MLFSLSYKWVVLSPAGKCSPLHLLLHVGHEVAAELDCAGLKILCKHGPNTEHQNMDNKTPLVIAVEDRNKTALDVLVRN
ncbi:hypothetical protein DPMN_097152 [Dreissena polymorpha]|uniref:Uncharacterized protein n=1 Tax=Dreissena polymorpha TaxID=45954 RepID=A0A9D4LCF5_DREPO|nr:hypothetical protein DPMN_097152 [Dreissena polymorpha]